MSPNQLFQNRSSFRTGSQVLIVATAPESLWVQRVEFNPENPTVVSLAHFYSVLHISASCVLIRSDKPLTTPWFEARLRVFTSNIEFEVTGAAKQTFSFFPPPTPFLGCLGYTHSKCHLICSLPKAKRSGFSGQFQLENPSSIK